MTTVSQASRQLNFDDYFLENIGIPVTPTKTNEIDETMVPKVGLQFENIKIKLLYNIIFISCKKYF